MLQKIKNFLKRFLPPPTKTFIREVERILSAIKGVSSRVDAANKSLAQTDKRLLELSGSSEKNYILLSEAVRNNNSLISSSQELNAKELNAFAEHTAHHFSVMEEKQDQFSEAAVQRFSAIEHKQDQLTEATVQRFSAIENKQDKLSEANIQRFSAIEDKQDKLSEATVQRFSVIENKQDQLSEVTVQRFAAMEEKHNLLSGKINESITGVNKLETENDRLRQLIETQGEMIAALNGKLQQMEGKIEQSGKNVISAQRKTIIDIRDYLTRIQLRTTEQPRLSYFVLNILDHCNLRCKGCDHFACIAEKRFVELKSIQRDLAQMSKITGGRVTKIGVMGGEPLLHPQLNEILAETRKYFPETTVELVSNGILLNQQKEPFWLNCRENDITIVVTKYPISINFEKMEKTAEEYGVKFRYYGNTNETIKTLCKMPMDIEGKQDPIKSFFECYHANCRPLLMEGKFYSCTIAPNTVHFNKKFGTNMNMEEGDWIDIHSCNDINQLLQYMCSPKPFCRYCKTCERTYKIPWERSHQGMDEWTN